MLAAGRICGKSVPFINRLRGWLFRDFHLGLKFRLCLPSWKKLKKITIIWKNSTRVKNISTLKYNSLKKRKFRGLMNDGYTRSLISIYLSIYLPIYIYIYIYYTYIYYIYIYYLYIFIYIDIDIYTDLDLRLDISL